MIPKITSEEMKKELIKRLSHNFGINSSEATLRHIYDCLVMIINDISLNIRGDFISKAAKQGTKQVYYLCMEFLIGKSLKNTLYNLGLESVTKNALSEIGVDIDQVYNEECDAGLGNGGLGRLAACFLDSLSSQGYCAMGYSLKYEYGIFRQKLVNGWQTELPDFWLSTGEIWLQPNPPRAVKVLFGGEIQESWENNEHKVNHINASEVIAVPYDLLIVGMDGKAVNKLRLWEARSKDFDMKLFNSGDYLRAIEQDAMAEAITKVLYPGDHHPEGKSLRVSQQYFLVSATIQDIISRHLRNYKDLDTLPDFVSIHLNDTHPVLAIPEMMRVLMDNYNYSWDCAWDIVTRTIAYTNHTVMIEALECWKQDLIRSKLPRIYQIIEEINRRFCEKQHQNGVDGNKIGKMAIINDGFVKMANLAVTASHSINGVSQLHSNILKNRVFKNFYDVYPEKFKNVTNGIMHRRWLCQANPKLTAFISELIGDDFIYDAEKLKNLEKFKSDKTVLQTLEKIKLFNKKRLARHIKNTSNITVDPESIFDTHAKRLHEYKRQLMNALDIFATYLNLKDNPNQTFIPKTYIFSAKAAPSYYFAKQIIRFIYELSKKIQNDNLVKDKLKVVFLEDYSVTLAEVLLPATEISQQISLAGSEASGTGNMKMMINGAVTLGTMDGANVEIYEAVGKDNIVIFGMTQQEVDEMNKHGYNPLIYYNNNSNLRYVIDNINNNFSSVDFKDIKNSLLSLDPFMVMADFVDYREARGNIYNIYKDRDTWNKMSLINIANAGRFSADRAIKDYAKNIWNICPVETKNEEFVRG